MQMETNMEHVYVQRYVVKSCPVTITFDKSVKLNKSIPKGEIIGTYSLDHSTIKYDIINQTSGKITYVSPSELLFENEDKNLGEIVLLSIEKCKHEVVYGGTCTECCEPNIKEKDFGQRGAVGCAGGHDCCVNVPEC